MQLAFMWCSDMLLQTSHCKCSYIRLGNTDVYERCVYMGSAYILWLLTGSREGRCQSWWPQRRQPGWREWHRLETPGPACWRTSRRQTPPWPWRSAGWSHTRACCSAGRPPPQRLPGPPGERWPLWALCRSEVERLCFIYFFTFTVFYS